MLTRPASRRLRDPVSTRAGACILTRRSRLRHPIEPDVSPTPSIFKIIFRHQGDVLELYARQVAQSSLFGFIEVEELLFGQHSNLLVDPNEESLRREFEGVKRLYLPMHAVVRIDEVEREGKARVRATKEREDERIVRAFPLPIPPPGTRP